MNQVNTRMRAQAVIGIGPGKYVAPHDPPSGAHHLRPAAEPSVIVSDEFEIDETRMMRDAANERAWKAYYRETLRRSIVAPARWIFDWFAMR